MLKLYKPLFDSDQVILYTGSIVKTASLLLWTKSGKPFEDSSSNETVFTTYSFCNSITLFVGPRPFSPGQLWRSEPAVLRFLRGWLAIESAERFLQWIHQQSLETHNIFYMQRLHFCLKERVHLLATLKAKKMKI